MVQVPRAVVTSLTRGDTSAAEEAVERAVAAGTRFPYNNMIFPSADMVRRLQKVETVATKGTFIVTCFVDLCLAPPTPLLKGMDEALKSVTHTEKDQRLSPHSMKPTFFFTEQESSKSGHRSNRTPSPVLPPSRAGANRLKPLRQQLLHEPKGPYLVRVPIDATVEQAAAVIQNRLRIVQQQERAELQQQQQAASGSNNRVRPVLYGMPLSDMDDIASRREAALQRAMSPPPPAGKQQTLDSSVSLGRLGRGRRASGSSPALENADQNPHKALFPSSLAGSKTEGLTTGALLSVRSVTSDDILGPNVLSIKALAALPLSIPNVGNAIPSESITEMGITAPSEISNHFLGEPFSSFDAFGAGLAVSPSATSIGNNASFPSHGECSSAVNASLKNLYAEAFEARLLTIRPCDANGNVLRHVNPHASITVGTSTSLTSSSLRSFEPRTKTLLTCFPKGTTTFHVCLSPDDSYHRQLIRDIHQQRVEEAEHAQGELEAIRSRQLKAKDERRDQDNTASLRNSLLRDQELRSQLNRPTATNSFKAFVKEEAREEYEKQQVRLRYEVDAARSLAKEKFRVAMQTFWRRVVALNEVCMSQIATMHCEEDAQWLCIRSAEAASRKDMEQQRRLVARRRFVAESVAARALAASEATSNVDQW